LTAAVAIGKKIVAVDLFDKPSTCGKVSDRLMLGYVLDAPESHADEVLAEAGDVEKLLGAANGLAWEKAEPIGEGEEWGTTRSLDVHRLHNDFGSHFGQGIREELPADCTSLANRLLESGYGSIRSRCFTYHVRN
jgi:hypothetical protein